VSFKAALFDLDGTLADTAPDLGGALNALRKECGVEPLALDVLRPHTSAGTRGMLRAGFGLAPSDTDYPALATRFLELYASRLCVDTTIFPGLASVLDHFDRAGIPWGVITNKPARFTEPLLTALGLASRCACRVSGDSAQRPKPAPDPMHLAAQQIGIPEASCLYVGDDLRDIQAGLAAGMKTVAVRWGYLGVDHPIDTWRADWIIDTPEELLGFF